ncbi:hypothetical protein BRC89_03130 [Halobacteriales archaeon QS_4_70_19]|nr:MAG: hypothetical protein BRC89_03130 [Halobacteriales archaeon QS_4_70_19]
MSFSTAAPTSGLVSTLPQVPLVFSGDFLQYAVVFLVLAVVAALLGARGIAGVSMEIARILVVIFIILFVVSLIL